MFDFIGSVFNTIIFEPLLNLLVAIINILPNDNLGVAVILVTVLIRLVMYPFSQNSLKTQRKLTKLRPQLKALEEKYKDNREKRAQEQIALYRQHNINPLGAISFPLFIQLPILFGLYKVFVTKFDAEHCATIQESLYFTYNTCSGINTEFFGINLLTSSLILAILAATAQFFQARSLATQTPKQGDKYSDFQKSMNMSLMYILPLVILVFGVGIPGVLDGLPAGIALYWTVSTVISHIQQHFVHKKDKQEQEEQQNAEQEQSSNSQEQQTSSPMNAHAQPRHKRKKHKKKKRNKK